MAAKWSQGQSEVKWQSGARFSRRADVAKKSGERSKTSLRMNPALHRRLARAADKLGIGINDLINTILHVLLPMFEGMGNAVSTIKAPELFMRWQQLFPDRPIVAFWADVADSQQGIPLQTRDGKFYGVNAAGDDFVETRPPSEKIMSTAEDTTYRVLLQHTGTREQKEAREANAKAGKAKKQDKEPNP
jgi:hypothetical protein